jgi:hypothetical protein
LKKAVLGLSTLFLFAALLGLAFRVDKKDIPTHSPVSQAHAAPLKSSPGQKSPSISAKSSARSTAQVASVVQEKKSQNKVITLNGKIYPLRVYKALSAPNDPLATQWWNMSTDINTAWSIGAGTTPTLLAVIDTGFALQHEEFTNRWYQNPGEVGATTSQAPSRLNCADRHLTLNESCNLIDDDEDGIVDNESGPTTEEASSIVNCTDRGLSLDKSCNLIDDDNNGLPDDVTGWDFVNYHPSVQAGKTNPNGSGTQHGTMTTGVAAATGNNSKGIAGINWSTKILPIEALNDDGYGDTLTVSRAVRYAADEGADVISISLGSSAEDPYLRQAIDYAIGKGSIIVAAAGNDGCNCISYPANYEEVVAVGALSTNNQRASFSSWGANLDIMAPGVNMTSSSWSPTNQASAYATGIAGTSFATPFVAGLLTLAKSHQPQASPLQLIASVKEQADRTGISSTPDTQMGFGRVRAGPEMTRVTQPSTPLQVNSFNPISGGDSLGSYEKVEPFYAYDCGGSASMPIYKLSKNGQSTYSISEIEKSAAISQGYSSSLFSYTCLNLPGDIPNVIHSINIYSEFENRTVKQ